MNELRNQIMLNDIKKPQRFFKFLWGFDVGNQVFFIGDLWCFHLNL